MSDKCKYCPYWQYNSLLRRNECDYDSDYHLLDKSHACKKAIKNMIKAGKSNGR